jgi:membrane protein implicated in regulation of membrane protease activity
MSQYEHKGAAMEQSSIWWLLAGTVIAAELLTGTFYLLMLSVGLMAAAIAAHLGVTLAVQLVVAAGFGGGCILGWRAYRQRQPAATPAGANRDVNLDIGESVQVDAWRQDGTSSVKYRGANWTVSLKAGTTPSPGTHLIDEVVGNRLIVSKHN